MNWRLAPTGDRGSAALEAAVLAGPVLALLAAAIVGMRVEIAAGSVEQAAYEAARAASISRTAAEARAKAIAAASDTLDQRGLRCQSLALTVDTSGFSVPVGQPASVTVTTRCVVDLSDVAMEGLPGSKTVTSTVTSPLDAYRGRT